MSFLKKQIKLLSEDEIYLGMFDLPRGIFMLLVMVTHAVLAVHPVWTYSSASPLSQRLVLYGYNIVYMGTIPLLFLMCGYGWRKRSIKKALKTQAEELGKPYALVVLAYFIIICLRCFMQGEVLRSDFIRYLLSCLLGWASSSVSIAGVTLASIGPIWCLVAYFFASLLLNTILHEREEWARWALVILAVFLGTLLGGRALPYCFQQSLVCTGYMYVGWKMKKDGFFTKTVPVYLPLLSIPFAVYSCYHDYIDFSHHQWPHGIFTISVCLFMGVCLLFALLKLNSLKGKLAEGIRWIGRNAMAVCCTHTVIYIWLPSLPIPALPAGNSIQRLGSILLISFIYILTACGVVFLIKELPKRLKKKKAISQEEKG